MNNKRLCFTAFVSGELYQNYIPIFLYSIFRSYPNSHSIIYCQDAIPDNVQEQLNILNKYSSFDIVEDYYSDIKVSGQRLKALRWVNNDLRLREYKYVYNADIDIFYINETPELLEQHIYHSNLLKIPLSNVFRPISQIKNRNLTTFLRRIYFNGFFHAIKSLKESKVYTLKASGLHFVETQGYYNKIEPYMEKYFNYIIDEKVSFLHHKDGFHNESLLADILSEAGFKDKIPISNDSVEALDYSKYKTYNFRPHHGLHLGIFSNNESIKSNFKTIEHPVYQEYIKKYLDLIISDDLYERIKKLFSKNLLDLLKNMEECYK